MVRRPRPSFGNLQILAYVSHVCRATLRHLRYSLLGKSVAILYFFAWLCLELELIEWVLALSIA